MARMRSAGTGLLLLPLLLLVAVVLSEGTEEEGRLELVVLITRHGDRTPLRTFPHSRSTWPEGLGELTGLGMRQMFELGSAFRTRYIDQRAFLSPSYNRSQFYAQSTAKDRTLMSADSFLHGFYPAGSGPKHNGTECLPHAAQAVPVFSDRKENDYLLYAHKNCAIMQPLNRQKKESERWQSATRAHQPLLTYLSREVGEPMNLDLVGSLVTLCKAELIHNRPTLPHITHNATLFAHMEQLQHFSKRLIYWHPVMHRLASGSLLPHIVERMRLKNEPTRPSHQFVYFSAHDSNLLAIFAALDLLESQPVPQYAAHLVFELYHAAHPYVIMLYNFQPVLIPACSALRCPFSEFEQIILSKTSSDIVSDCQVPKQRDEL